VVGLRSRATGVARREKGDYASKDVNSGLFLSYLCPAVLAHTIRISEDPNLKTEIVGFHKTAKELHFGVIHFGVSRLLMTYVAAVGRVAPTRDQARRNTPIQEEF
jgi:hypothetical protein